MFGFCASKLWLNKTTPRKAMATAQVRFIVEKLSVTDHVSRHSWRGQRKAKIKPDVDENDQVKDITIVLSHGFPQTTTQIPCGYVGGDVGRKSMHVAVTEVSWLDLDRSGFRQRRTGEGDEVHGMDIRKLNSCPTVLIFSSWDYHHRQFQISRCSRRSR
jgi:hypothetical protein